MASILGPRTLNLGGVLSSLQPFPLAIVVNFSSFLELCFLFYNQSSFFLFFCLCFMFQHFCVIICLVITSPQFPYSFVYVHVRTFLSIRNNENVIQRASFPSFPTARKNLRHPLCKFRPPHLLNFNLMSRNSRHPLCKV